MLDMLVIGLIASKQLYVKLLSLYIYSNECQLLKKASHSVKGKLF